MGGLLNRSPDQIDGRKMKEKKDKRKIRHQQFDDSYASDIYFMQDRYENVDIDGDTISSYEVWENNFDQQQIMNMNDPPGAPITNSHNYPIHHNNVMIQSWSPSHNANNSFYPMNPHQISYNPNQFSHVQLSNTISNPLQRVKLEERPSKKVKFSPVLQQHSLPLKPLTNTASFHETSDVSTPSPKTQSLPSSNRISKIRSTAVVTPSSSPVQKPIYVAIDYKATLAERDQVISNKSQRKNGERSRFTNKNSPENHHRSQSQTSHRNKIPKSILKSSDNSQSKSVHSQPPLRKSMSTNVLIQHMEQSPLRNDENHRRHRRSHHHHQDSPHRSSNMPVMRIPLSQHNRHQQKQPMILSSTHNAINLTRI